MKILSFCILLLLSSFALAQMPDAASQTKPQSWEQAKGKPANLFTYRTNWQDPKLRGNKQILKSPVFWISQGVLWVADDPGVQKSALRGRVSLGSGGYRFHVRSTVPH